MTEPINIIKNELLDILVTVKQLEELETYEDADYSDVISDFRWNHKMLRNRLCNLQERQ